MIQSPENTDNRETSVPWKTEDSKQIQGQITQRYMWLWKSTLPSKGHMMKAT